MPSHIPCPSGTLACSMAVLSTGTSCSSMRPVLSHALLASPSRPSTQLEPDASPSTWHHSPSLLLHTSRTSHDLCNVIFHDGQGEVKLRKSIAGREHWPSMLTGNLPLRNVKVFTHSNDTSLKAGPHSGWSQRKHAVRVARESPVFTLVNIRGQDKEGTVPNLNREPFVRRSSELSLNFSAPCFP